jgi:hypothetical protein
MSPCNRTLDQARRDFAAGVLKKAAVLRTPMQRAEWTIHLAGRKGDAGQLLDSATLAPRVFKTLDSAARALEEIGFAVTSLNIG